jgi:hypothetical protein
MPVKVGIAAGRGKRLVGEAGQDYRRGMTRFAPLALILMLAGCAQLFPPAAPAPGGPAPVSPTAPAPAVLGQGQTAAALDRTTEAERAAAVAVPAAAGARDLGRVTVALGSPAEQGFWLKSGLVTAPGRGRVELASGASVAVDLLPGSGGGLLSLAAYRALGLGLTDLPEVRVFAE